VAVVSLTGIATSARSGMTAVTATMNNLSETAVLRVY
jgi:hypothetical protein